MQRDDRVHETALLYGTSPLEEASAQRKQAKKAVGTQNQLKAPVTTDAFQSVVGWAPQVISLHGSQKTLAFQPARCWYPAYLISFVFLYAWSTSPCCQP